MKDHERILEGMRRAGKRYAKKADHSKFHPLDMEKAKELYLEGRLFFDETEDFNQRKAHCKICGKELKKGEGICMPIYAENFYNLSFHFSCIDCKKRISKEIRR